MIKRYKTVANLADDMKAGKLHREWISPGAAAALARCTRQAIHNRINRGTLDCIKTIDGSVVLVDGRQLVKRQKELAGG